MGVFQNYMKKCTKKTLQALELAVSELVALHQTELTPDFILLGLLSQQDNEPNRLLKSLLDNPLELATQLRARLKQEYQDLPASENQSVTASAAVAELMQLALDESLKLGDDYISTGTLFIALFEPVCVKAASDLKQAGLSQKAVRDALTQLHGGRAINTDTGEQEADVLEKYTLADLLKHPHMTHQLIGSFSEA